MNRQSAMPSAWLMRLLPGGRRARLVSTLLVALAMLVGNPFSVAAANPPTVQLFYVALPDDDLQTLFDVEIDIDVILDVVPLVYSVNEAEILDWDAAKALRRYDIAITRLGVKQE